MANLKIQNVTKIYNGNKILDDVSFEVIDGEFLSILGPSGCGKTTLLRIIVGIEKPDVGSITKNDKDITNLDASKRNMDCVRKCYVRFGIKI